MRRTVTRLMGCLAVSAAGAALGVDSAVVANLTAVRVITAAGGQESLVPATRARPGDVLEYRVDYHNTTKSGIGNLVATLPVPPVGVEYIPGSDAPSGAQASVDGKTFAPIPLMRTVKLSDGRTAQEPVPPGEYRFLRWTLDALPAGAHKTVSARVRLINETTSAVPPTSNGTRQ